MTDDDYERPGPVVCPVPWDNPDAEFRLLNGLIFLTTVALTDPGRPVDDYAMQRIARYFYARWGDGE